MVRKQRAENVAAYLRMQMTQRPRPDAQQLAAEWNLMTPQRYFDKKQSARVGVSETLAQQIEDK
jgi:hypothetical protein